MRKILGIIVDKVYWLLVTIVIFFAVIVAITPALTPILNHYKRDFTAWAEIWLHKPVKIEKIEVKWNGLHPVLDLRHVVVFDKTNTKKILQLNDLQVSLNFVKSLRQHKIIMSPLFIAGVKLVLLQRGEKQWAINGFVTGERNINTASGEFTAMASWLLSLRQLVLQDVSIVIKNTRYGQQTISDLTLVLSNQGENHYLYGQAFLAEHHKSPSSLVLLLHGSADDVKHLQGQFYWHANGFPINPWLADKTFLGFKLQQGKVDFALWGDWQQQKLDNMQLALQLSDAQLQSENKAPPLRLNQLTANLSWQRLMNGGWKIFGDNINVILNGHRWTTTTFGLSILHPASARVEQYFTIDNLHLQDLQSLLIHFNFLPKKIRQRWQTLTPTGEVKHVKFVHHGSLKKLNRYALRFDFANLQWRQYKNIPGISGLTGAAAINNDNGQIVLRSNKVTFNAPHLFRQPLLLKQVTTEVQWQKAAANWIVQAQNINIQSPQIDLQGNMQLRLPINKGSPHINLQARYTGRQLGQLKKYFPTKIMPKNLVAWLDQAFIKGTSAQGKLLLFGALNEFAYVHNDGQFIVDTTIQGLELNYLPNWPKIKNLCGNLVFNKRQMHFILQSGSIAQQNITALTAVIPDMAMRPQAHLHIDSHLQLDDINAGKQFILQSPLRNTIGKTLTPLQILGKAALQLQLNIPLRRGKTIVDGKLQLQQSNLSIPTWHLRFNDINGALHFNNEGLSAKKLTTTFLHKPANISIKTLHVEKNRITRFNMIGALQATDVKSYFAINNRQHFVSGRTPFRATLDIPAKGKKHLLVESQLRGISINLPEPYYKTKEKPRSLRIDSYFNDAKVSTIEIHYASLLAAVLAYTTQGKQFVFSRANIHFGNGGVILPTQPGIFVTGQLQDFSWAKWQQILMPYLRQIRKTHGMKTNSNVVLKSINLVIQHFQAYQQCLHNLSLHIMPDNLRWIFSFDSQKIAGKLKVSLDYQHKTTVGYFKRLNLDFPHTASNKTGKQFAPRDILPINISVDQFSYNHHGYGKVKLVMSPLANGVKISTISIMNPLYTLKASGQWLRINQKDQSMFSGILSTSDLGALLQQQGFTDHINKGKGTATFKLAWPDVPTAFRTQDLYGNVSAEFTDGGITGLDQQTKQKIGLGKLINLLSLSSLAHHLTLDFRSLEKKGYVFSIMRGDLRLQDGKVSSSNIYLDGNVAEVYLTGELGLKKQLYNLNLTINPYLTSSLPVLAAIVAGPIAGIATWAVNKLIRPGMKKIIFYQYHIGGSWKEPVITKNNKLTND